MTLNTPQNKGYFNITALLKFISLRISHLLSVIVIKITCKTAE